MAIRVDVLIGKLLHLIDEKVGLQNTIVVLTADDGVSPTPLVNQKRNMPGTYVSVHAGDLVESSLDQHFGAADWVESAGEGSVYLNWKPSMISGPRTGALSLRRTCIAWRSGNIFYICLQVTRRRLRWINSN